MIGRLSIVLLLALSSVRVAAQEKPPREATTAEVFRRLQTMPDAAQQLTVIDRALAALMQPTPDRGMLLCMRSEVLEGLNRSAEARLSFDQCRVLLPNEPKVLLASARYNLIDGRPVEATGQLIRAAALQPSLVNQVSVETMQSLLRQLRYAGRDELASQLIETLVSTGYGREDPRAFSALLLSVIIYRLNDGKTAEAVALLPSMIDPDAGLRLMIDRRATSIWPDLDRWAGGDFTAQRNAYVEATQARFLAENTPAALRPYADALAKTGRRADAIKLLSTWVGAHGRDDDEAWELARSTVRLALFLAGDGRRAEGIARMQAALALGAGGTYATANITPNLVTELLLQNDYKGALDVLDKHTPAASDLESPAALGYFVALRGCAEEGLGRSAEANAALLTVRAAYAMNDGAVGIATSCVATPADRVAAWIALADEETSRGGALYEFAKVRFQRDHAVPPKSISEMGMLEVVDDPRAQQVYDRYARPVPARYAAAFAGFNAVPSP